MLPAGGPCAASRSKRSRRVGNIRRSDVKFLADIADGDSLGTIAGGRMEALDWLEERLPAELEGLMMHRHEAGGARVVAHPPGLLGRAVIVDPRVIGADRHDGQVDR